MSGRKSPPREQALWFGYALLAVHMQHKRFSASIADGAFALVADNIVTSSEINRQRKISQSIADLEPFETNEQLFVS